VYLVATAKTPTLHYRQDRSAWDLQHERQEGLKPSRRYLDELRLAGIVKHKNGCLAPHNLSISTTVNWYVNDGTVATAPSVLVKARFFPFFKRPYTLSSSIATFIDNTHLSTPWNLLSFLFLTERSSRPSPLRAKPRGNGGMRVSSSCYALECVCAGVNNSDHLVPVQTSETWLAHIAPSISSHYVKDLVV
jgi:hypothetical protein